jgi:ABC-type uncharacterized transport system substrate-binding protein
MRRRDFITLLGGAAAAWPLAARAQQPVPAVIGILSGVSFEGAFASYVDDIRLGLKEMGFVEGQNLAIEYRSAEGHPERLPELAADLVRRQVAVILAIGGTVSALAAKAVTSAVPIVFANGGDAVESGLVKSLSRPGANVTGISFATSQLAPKRLDLLRDLVPQATRFGFLENMVNPSDAVRRDLGVKAQSIGCEVVFFFAGTEPQIDEAFAGMARQHVAGLIMSADAYLNTRRLQIIALAERHAIPMIVPWGGDSVTQGALMSYATWGVFRPAGVYVDRILKGAKPAELPVQLPTRFQLAINLKTAKALGLTVSRDMQLIADEVVE